MIVSQKFKYITNKYQTSKVLENIHLDIIKLFKKY